MNAKATRTILNEAFKQFQRLPDWSSVAAAMKSPVLQPGANPNWTEIAPLAPRDWNSNNSQPLAKSH
jgi:hypothetical protein